MKIPFVGGVLIALVSAGAVFSGYAASFSADLVNTRGETSQTCTFNFQDKSYRFEQLEKGQKILVIYDAKSGVTRVVNSAEKAYYEAGPEDPLSRFSSPFGFYAFASRQAQTTGEGTETIAGIECKKQLLSSNGQEYARACFSEEFGFPLKVVVPLFQQSAELKNIKRGPQDPALFTVPADYKLTVVDTRPPAPEWADQVARAPLLTPPFEQTVTEGKIVRLRLQAGRTIRLVCTNARKEPSAFTTVGFKDGRPTSELSGNTMNLNADDEVTSTISRAPEECDHYIVRVGIGSVKIKAILEGGVAGASTGSANGQDAPPPEFPAEVQVPASVNMASRFEVTWSGPGAANDYISVALPEHPANRQVTKAGIREGNPVKIWAPSDPGQYEVRYILGTGQKVLAKIPLTVAAVTASLEAPATVKAAGWIEAKWDGPAGEGDCVTVARSSQNAGGALERTAVRQGNPLRVRAPSEAGAYEVRYLLAHANRILTKSMITVEEVTATLTPPNEAKAGVNFEIAWTGPGYPEDIVTIARLDQPLGQNLGNTRLRMGSTARLKAPKEPGAYEIRYILGRGQRLLAKTAITVSPP